MKRQQLEHILRAAAVIIECDEIVVIGSQAVLASHANASGALAESIEADVFTFRSPKDAEIIDGSIGEHSMFHRTFGYYAHGVGAETATLSDGWRDRLIRLGVTLPGGGEVRGLCLEPNDLAVSKIAAGRDKDFRFVRELLAEHIADPSVIDQRFLALADPVTRDLCRTRLQRLTSSGQ